MASRLNLLMKTFSILGKDLSDLMHIDSSLISKWRSGKRKLKPKSVYVEKIVSHIMELDRPNHNINICKLLANEYENVYTCSEKEIAIFLKAWLTSECGMTQRDSMLDELRETNSASMCMLYRFKDKKGRRKAVNFLLDYAIANSPDLEMLCHTDENASWFYEDKLFLKEWGEKNAAFLQKGSHIKVIHPVDRNYENTATSMFKWMPLHLTGKTRAFYIPKYTHEPLAFTIFLVPNHMVAYNTSSKDYCKCLYTYLTNDPAILDNSETILQGLFEISIPIFKRYTFDVHIDYLNYLVSAFESKKEKFVYCSTFLFIPISEYLLKKIFEYNGISDEKSEQYSELYNLISSMNLRYKTRYVVNYDRIKELIEQQEVILDSMSFLMGMRIRASKELFAKVMEQALDQIPNTDQLEIGKTDSTTLHDIGKINIVAQETSSSQFFSTDYETPLSMVTTEMTVVQAVYQRMENTWNAIPRLYRNKDFVCNQLREMLLAGNGKIKKEMNDDKPQMV